MSFQITPSPVLAAMATVPRERFVPAALAVDAYEDQTLPIGNGQTISTPGIVAVMAAALELTGTERVLEVGTGAGYAAAVLSRCAAQVLTIERRPRLAAQARASLAALGYHNVEVRHGDGTRGGVDRAPFDAISVAAVAAEPSAALLAQRARRGRLVCPVGTPDAGRLVRLRGDVGEDLGPVRFVPLITDQP
ncbi:MAG: protein-L-isoaspartate(D-aspartate) O-methyltransferase [Streptosporangiaceae bacterium]